MLTGFRFATLCGYFVKLKTLRHGGAKRKRESNLAARRSLLSLQSPTLLRRPLCSSVDSSAPATKSSRFSVKKFDRRQKAHYNKMDGGDNHFESKRIVFVTVGTTSFDSLVRTVDTDQVKEELSKKGYTHLVIQMGRGSHIPNKSSGEDGSLAVDYFTFCSSIADYLRSASLVISHAGSGSIFETLRLGKPLIVVVNEDLMDNHQSELAEELAERKHLSCARPQTLFQVIQVLDLDSIVPYHPGDANPVAKLINRYLGFPAD